MKLTNNFNLSEFACKDGTEVPNELIDNVTELAENLQVLRDFIGLPIKINSGYRTKEHNAKQKGSATNSKHLTAQAADIKVVGMKPADLAQTIEALIDLGKMKQGGLGVYNTFVHYDTFFDGEKIRRWDLRK